MSGKREEDFMVEKNKKKLICIQRVMQITGKIINILFLFVLLVMF